ncbi:MAG: hypothetical protein N3F03_09150 [Ignavibacteria bacterium]|nr:hypothetical protein [Ignavibacteria bacterium]
MLLLNEMIIPFNYQYSNVLQLIQILAHSIFYFYFLWLTGSVILSYYFEFIRRDDAHTYFAKILLNLPLKNLYFPIVLGVIPFVVIYSVDLIWLVGEEFQSIHNLTLFTFIILILSIYFANSYKTTFELISVLQKTVGDKEDKDYLLLMNKNLSKHKKSALLSLLGLLITLYLFSILTTAKLDYIKGDFRVDFIANLFSLDSFVRYTYYLTIAFSLSFLGSLFFNFSWSETRLDLSEGLGEFIKQISLNGAIITILLQPLLILIELFLFPKNSLSYLLFLSSGFALILLFLILNQLNAFKKESNQFYIRYSFFLFIAVILSVSTRDISGIGNVLRPKTIEITQKFVTYEENLKAKLNIQTVSINPEDIFNAKCSACHRFDTKLVGPPYNIVLKKYENNRDQLVKFILNPVKVDPAYPPMPAQGLIPPEAEAVADYILKIYKENSK